MILGPDFRMLIKSAGWNQRKLSAKLGYSEGWLSNIIRGKRDMKLSDFRTIVEATGVPPHRLLGIELPSGGTDWVRMVRELDKAIPKEARELLMQLWGTKNKEG